MARKSNPTYGFGSVLRERRSGLGLTLAQLAGETELTGSYLSRLENNAVPVPPVETLIRIAEALQINVSDLMTAAGRMPVWVLQAYDETPEAFQALARMSAKERRAFSTGRSSRKKKTSRRGKDPDREEVKRLVRRLKPW